MSEREAVARAIWRCSYDTAFEDEQFPKVRDGYLTLADAALDAVREQIAARLDEEADLTPCEEDAKVVRDCALLVRTNFSYDEAERLSEGGA